MNEQIVVTAPAPAQLSARQLAIQKMLQHIEHLRTGQARRLGRRHRARYNALERAQAELKSRGVWVENPGYQATALAEVQVFNAAFRHAKTLDAKGWTREQLIEWQMGFARTVISQADRERALQVRTRPEPVKAEKPVRKYVSVAKADILAVTALVTGIDVTSAAGIAFGKLVAAASK